MGEVSVNRGGLSPILPEKSGTAPPKVSTPKELLEKINIRNAVANVRNEKQMRRATLVPPPRSGVKKDLPPENFAENIVLNVRKELKSAERIKIPQKENQPLNSEEMPTIEIPLIVKEHVEEIKTYFDSSSMKEELANLTETKHFPTEKTGLPYSVVFEPSTSPLSGLHILLKTKGAIESRLGTGAAKAVTHSLHIDQDQKETYMAFGSAKESNIGKNELEINKYVFEKGSDRLEKSHIINYIGKVSPREGGHQETNVEKVGFIMNPANNDLYKLTKIEGDDPDIDTTIDRGIQAADALADLHGLGIVHGDIKTNNFYSHEENLRLGDFGSSTFIGERAVTGTPQYMSPENEQMAKTSDDIWSLGFALCEVLYNRDFYGEVLHGFLVDSEKDYDTMLFNNEAFENSKQAFFDSTHLEGEVVNEIVSRCFSLDPKERPTAHEVAEALKDYKESLDDPFR